MGLWSSIGTVVGGYFGPAGSAVGGAIGGAIDSDSAQDEAEKFSTNSAVASRDWQERMSNTSYQRGMKDMQAAGLNPMLAYSQGGANVPVGATAQYPGAVGAQTTAAGASVSSAAAAESQASTAAKIGDTTVRKTVQEIENLKSTNDQIKAIVLNLGQEYQNLVKEGYNKTEVGNHLRATIDKLKAEIPLINSEIWRNEASSALAKMQTRLSGLDVSAAEGVGNIGREAGQLKPIFDIIRMFLLKR